MQTARILRVRTPLIQFIGKRTIPESIDHTPRIHPASPSGSSLPISFKQYRESYANTQGPLHSPAYSRSSSSKQYFTAQVKEGQYFDRSELPDRFKRMRWTAAEIAAVESGGASMFAWIIYTFLFFSPLRWGLGSRWFIRIEIRIPFTLVDLVISSSMVVRWWSTQSFSKKWYWLMEQRAHVRYIWFRSCFFLIAEL